MVHLVCIYRFKVGWTEAADWLWASSVTVFRFFLAPRDDSSWTLQRLKLCCVYIKLFYKLVDVFFFFLTADGLTAARTQEETGLILFSYVVSITSLLYKGGSLMAWRVHSAPLPMLLSLFEPHKRKRAWRCQRRGIRLCGLSRETSAARYSLEGDVLQCGANSPWGRSSIRHNLFIYHIQDLSTPLTNRDIQRQRHKGHAFTAEAVVLPN